LGREECKRGKPIREEVREARGEVSISTLKHQADGEPGSEAEKNHERTTLEDLIRSASHRRGLLKGLWAWKSKKEREEHKQGESGRGWEKEQEKEVIRD